MFSYVFLLLSVCAAIAQGLECKAVDGDHFFCSCAMDDGSGTVDISPYAKTDRTPRFTGTDGHYTYEYNPCFPMNVDGYSACEDSSAAGCQTVRSDGYKIGKFDQVDYSINYDSNVVITYSGGDDERIMRVTLKCNRDLAEPRFVAEGEYVERQYDFTLESKCSCPYKEGKSCNSGGGGSNNGGSDNNGGGGENIGEKIKDKLGVFGIVLLCIGLLIVALLYVSIVGTIILAKRHRSNSSDSAPTSVKDSIMLMFSPCYKRMRGTQGYTAVSTTDDDNGVI